MLSKYWNHPSVYLVILKPQISRGNFTLIPKGATQEKENFKTEKEKEKKKEKSEKYQKGK